MTKNKPKGTYRCSLQSLKEVGQIKVMHVMERVNQELLLVYYRSGLSVELLEETIDLHLCTLHPLVIREMKYIDHISLMFP